MAPWARWLASARRPEAPRRAGPRRGWLVVPLALGVAAWVALVYAVVHLLF